MRNAIQICVLATAFAMTGLLPASAWALQLDNLFVFGDSLSDGGNSGLRTQQYTGNPLAVFPPFPYYNGQYSNGPVAAQYLWDSYNPGNPGGFIPSLAGGTNYAIGGATTGTVNFNAVNPNVPPPLQPAFSGYGAAWELQQFLASPYVSTFNPSTSLFLVWLFPNDVFYTSQTGLSTGTVPGSPGGPDLVSNGIANIVTTIQTLAAIGAQHFLVMNLPDLGLVPEFLGTPEAPSLSGLTTLFNTNLSAQLTALDQLLPGEIIQFDVNAAFEAILADPVKYGFTNTTEACVANLLSGICNPGNWDSWVFWDGVHPTTATDRILASELRASIPEPGTIALLGIGLLGLGINRRTRTRC
jgi:phospholipase/lecithinase/hemolysin